MRQHTLLLALCVCAAVAVAKQPADVQDARAATLLQRQAASSSKIITLSSEEWEELAMSEGRPYSLVVFCAAQSLMNSPITQLGKLRQEFSLAAQAFARGPDAKAGKLFFVDLWYEKSGPLFARLGVDSVPFAFVWRPSAGPSKGGAIKIGEDVRMLKGFTKYPWPAEEIVAWVVGKAHVAAGEVDRPSFLKSPLFPLAAGAVLLLGAAVAWRLYNSPLVQNTAIWALGSLVVYWFSVSGGMYNIIRGMPMVTYRDGKAIWWMAGRQGQLGAEGFFMGTLYMFLSLCLCALIYGTPRIASGTPRFVVSSLALVLAGVTLLQIITLWQHKTGFDTRSFFF